MYLTILSVDWDVDVMTFSSHLWSSLLALLRGSVFIVSLPNDRLEIRGSVGLSCGRFTRVIGTSDRLLLHVLGWQVKR